MKLNEPKTVFKLFPSPSQKSIAIKKIDWNKNSLHLLKQQNPMSGDEQKNSITVEIDL